MATKAKATKDNPDEPIEEKVKAPKNGDHFEEWEGKITNTKEGPKFEKLKLVRKCVKITEEQANTLNEGRLTGGNTFTKMYFRPE